MFIGYVMAVFCFSNRSAIIIIIIIISILLHVFFIYFLNLTQVPWDGYLKNAYLDISRAYLLFVSITDFFYYIFFFNSYVSV